MFIRLLCSSGTTRRTSYANCANCLRCRRYELQALELKVTNEDGLTNLERSNINNELVWQVLQHTLNYELTSRQSQLTADLNTLGVTGQTYRDCNRYRLILLNTIEINVENLLANWVELNLTQNRLLYLTVELNLYDIRVRGVNKRLNRLSVNRESDILACTIQYARNHALATNALRCLLAVLGTCNCLNSKCFHFFEKFLIV